MLYLDEDNSVKYGTECNFDRFTRYRFGASSHNTSMEKQIIQFHFSSVITLEIEPVFNLINDCDRVKRQNLSVV